MKIQNLVEQGLLVENENFEYQFVHQPKPCEDCGKVVTDRRITITRHKHQKKIKRKCGECGLYYDEDTGSYTISLQDLNLKLRKIK